MSRTLLKLVLVLLVVGVLPFAASLFIVNDLLSSAVSVGLNPDVREHIERSADAHRQFFEAEKTGHELAATAAARDPGWEIVDWQDWERAEAQLERLLTSFEALHPRLVSASATVTSDPDGAHRVQVRFIRPDEQYVFRRETFVLEIEPPRAAERAGPRPSDESTSVAVALTFGLPFRYVQELEDIGETLDTFRALEVFEAQLTHGMRRTYLYFGGGVAVLALIVGTLLARQTVRRITRIEQAAARVAAGDLDVRVEAKGRDELAGLARQFNAMVEELQTSQERVAYLQRVSAWQEIARRLAHEIKNPLTPILLAMQQLDGKFEELADAPERFRPLLSDALEIVQEEVGTLRALVKEFSEFARLPAVDPEPVVVASFLEDFVRTNPQLQQLAELEVRVAPGCDSLVAELDTTMMRRVLVNLTENATDAAAIREDAENASRPSTIELAVQRKGDWVKITVEDEGCGIEEGQSEKVWDPYFTTKESGTGLGLAIVKKIVLSHGGDAAICNRDDGPGCRVTLRFPLSSATPRQAG